MNERQEGQHNEQGNCSGATGDGKREKGQLMRWGLVPFWAKDASIGSKMINPRAETVADSWAFKYAFQKRRCLIPEVQAG